MDLDCFIFDFVSFGISNGYHDVYVEFG